MQIFLPGSHLAVDECMVRYTGKSEDTTVMKSKPNPMGFKIWVIAQYGFFIQWLWHIKESSHGAVGVEISTQKSSSQGRPSKRRKVTVSAPDTEDKPMTMNPTQAVVVALTNMLPKATYHVFVDNLFLSSGLFLILRNHGHGATGTARTNSGINKELVWDKNNDGRVSAMYEFNTVKAIPTPDNQVNQIAWKDNKLVLFLNTVFTGADDERAIRRRKKPSSGKSEAKPIRRFFGDEAVKLINIPTVAAEYNDQMNHVDRGDQLRSYYAYDHPLRRGAWQALAWTFLLDVALVNSYVAQLRGPQPNWKRYTNQREWRECIYNELFNTYGHDSQARQRYRAGDERDLQRPELQREHINREINHVNRKVKSDCLACQGCRQGQLRAKSPEWSPLTEVSGNEDRKDRKRPKVRTMVRGIKYVSSPHTTAGVREVTFRVLRVSQPNTNTTHFEPFFDRVFAMASSQDLELQLRQLQEQQQLILQRQEQLQQQLQEQLARQHQELLTQLRSAPPRTPSPQPSNRASNTSRDTRISIRTLRSAGWTYQQIATHLRLTLRQVQHAATTQATPRRPSGRPPLLTQAQVEELIES
ncbi:hypothetical protein FALCPG4_18906 [Fusarium falciforme]